MEFWTQPKFIICQHQDGCHHYIITRYICCYDIYVNIHAQNKDVCFKTTVHKPVVDVTDATSIIYTAYK